MTNTSVTKKQPMSWMKKFVIGLSVFLVGSLGFLAIITPKAPELTAEQKAVIEAEKLATNALLDSFIVSASIENNSIGIPELHVVVKNTSEKTMDGIEITASFYNNFDEPAGEWGDPNDNSLLVRSQDVIAPGDSEPMYWNLTAFSGATKVTKAEVIRVHYTDGTEIARQYPSED